MKMTKMVSLSSASSAQNKKMKHEKKEKILRPFMKKRESGNGAVSNNIIQRILCSCVKVLSYPVCRYCSVYLVDCSSGWLQ
jgi:hypothetical protein